MPVVGLRRSAGKPAQHSLRQLPEVVGAQGVALCPIGLEYLDHTREMLKRAEASRLRTIILTSAHSPTLHTTCGHCCRNRTEPTAWTPLPPKPEQRNWKLDSGDCATVDPNGHRNRRIRTVNGADRASAQKYRKRSQTPFPSVTRGIPPLWAEASCPTAGQYLPSVNAPTRQRTLLSPPLCVAAALDKTLRPSDLAFQAADHVFHATRPAGRNQTATASLRPTQMLSPTNQLP